MAGVLAFATLLAGAAPAPTQQQLRESERARTALIQAQHDAGARAEAAQAEETRLAHERVDAAARLRGTEAATAEAASGVADLAARRREAEARLAERAAELAPLLPLAERLALYPAETLLAVPLSMDDAVRGVLVLRGMTRAIEADAAEIRAKQAEIAALQRRIDAELPRLAAAEAAQAQEAGLLDRRIAATRDNRRVAEDAGADAARRAAAEASHADSLRAAIARIEVETRAADARAADARAAEVRAAEVRTRAEALAQPHPRREALARSAAPEVIPATARGAMTSPVSGSVVHSFGEATDSGLATGISYQASPAARVVSPCGGRVVFAQPFRSFGQLIIVDCGGGNHIVLSGLDRLDVTVGQRVLAGEPVGVMPAWDPRGPAARPLLKLELRRDGSPVNPTPFLHARG